jgi:drug/metabolite transporter (DMT)-like permease
VATQRSAYIAWVVVCIVWGTTYLGIRITLETLPPFLMAACRWLSAGTLLAAGLLARGEKIPNRRSWGAYALLGVLMMGIGNGGVVWAEQTVPSGLTAVLVAAIPFWMVGIERFMFKGDPFTARRIAGLILGFLGIVLLVWPELGVSGADSFLLGVLATQFACLGWAIGSSISRRSHHTDNVLAASAMQMIFAGLALAAAGLAHGEWSAVAFNARTAWAMVYLVLAGSVVGYSAYAYALKYLPVTTVSLYAYINPIIAVALGTLWLDEPFSSRIVVASAVVLGGVLLVRGS